MQTNIGQALAVVDDFVSFVRLNGKWWGWLFTENKSGEDEIEIGKRQVTADERDFSR